MDVVAIIAIDPGTTNTGIVYMDERRVICCRTISYSQAVKGDQDALRDRAQAIARQVLEFAADKPNEAIVMEGFVTYKERQSSYTFQTPYLCGYLHSALEGEDVVIQTSRQVLNPRTRGNVADLKDLMAKGCEVYGDSLKCTNDHLRSAAAHGIYYYRNRG